MHQLFPLHQALRHPRLLAVQVSIMMRLYLSFYVYDDSAAPYWLLFGCCDELFLHKLSIHTLAMCHTGWGRVSRHDRLTFFFSSGSLSQPASLSKNVSTMRSRGPPYRHLLPLNRRPRLLLSHDSQRGLRPTKRHQLLDDRKKSFNTTDADGKRTLRNSAAFSDAITIVCEKK